MFFVVVMFSPCVSCAQEEVVCNDPAKILIGFGILVALFFVVLFTMFLIAYFSLGGRKHLKKIGVGLVLSLLLGVMSVTTGLVKEYSKNTIPFLHPSCVERNI